MRVTWVPRYCSTSLMESSKREPVLWVALTPLATNWQTSKRFIPCDSARCILSERMTLLRSTGSCSVRCGARQKRWDGGSRAGFSHSKGGTENSALSSLYARNGCRADGNGAPPFPMKVVRRRIPFFQKCEAKCSRFTPQLSSYRSPVSEKVVLCSCPVLPALETYSCPLLPGTAART